MSDLTTIHADMVSRLQGKASLRGPLIVSLDDPDYPAKVETALSQTRGLVVAIGNPGGAANATNVPGGQFDITVRSYILENQNLNRTRPLASTVANEAARLALTGVAAGARVIQSDVSKTYWLLTAGGEASATNWAELLVATQVLQLVIRSFQLWAISANQTVVCAGFDPGTADDLYDYIARFNLKVGLDSAAVT